MKNRLITFFLFSVIMMGCNGDFDFTPPDPDPVGPDPEPSIIEVGYVEIDIHWCNHLYDSNSPIHSGNILMINKENNVPALCNANLDLETAKFTWKPTSFDVGEYKIQAINDEFKINDAISQLDLQTITISRAGAVRPALKDVSNVWLKGNFNFLKYAEWINKRRAYSHSTNRIEWIFEDGEWIAIHPDSEQD